MRVVVPLSAAIDGYSSSVWPHRHGIRWADLVLPDVLDSQFPYLHTNLVSPPVLSLCVGLLNRTSYFPKRWYHVFADQSSAPSDAETIYGFANTDESRHRKSPIRCCFTTENRY